MDQYRGSNRDLYSSQGNGMGSRGGPYTPRGRGGFQRGDASFGGSRGFGYFPQEEHTGVHDHHGNQDGGLEKALSGVSLGKAFSGSMDGSEASSRLQRAASRGLEPGYPQRGYQPGLMRGGSDELGAFSPGSMGGRGEACAPGQWQGRGRGLGPVRQPSQT